MSKDSLFPQLTFIPKVRDTKFCLFEGKIEAIIIDANSLEASPSILECAPAKAELIIIDPVTHLLEFPESSGKPNYNKLPYSGVDASKIFPDPSYRLDQFIKPVVSYQNENNSSVIIAPYLCAEDNSSLNFNNNLTLASETIKNVASEKINKPIFVVVSIDTRVLSSRASINYVVDRYQDDFSKNIQGYIILIDNFDDRKASEQELLGLAFLSFQLSKKKDVLVKHIGSFGDVLCVLGASGYIAGLAESEKFSTSNFNNGNGIKRPRKHSEWTFVPEFFSHLNIAELEKIKYTCECPACKKIEGESESAVKKLHFLYCKNHALAELSSIPKEKRIDFLIAKLTKAKTNIYKLIASGSKLDATPIERWISVLNAAKNWDFDEDDSLLKGILNDLKDD